MRGWNSWAGYEATRCCSQSIAESKRLINTVMAIDEPFPTRYRWGIARVSMDRMGFEPMNFSLFHAEPCIKPRFSSVPIVHSGNAQVGCLH